MSITQYSDLDFLNVSKIVNLPDALNAQEPVTLAQLEAATLGLAWKDNARVSAPGNINLTAPGATIDGITLANGDRILLYNQTATSENGIYIWSGAAVPLVRSPDADTSDKLENAVIVIDEGTDAGVTLRQTQVNFVLDTDPVLFASFFPASGAASETSAGVIELAAQAETDAGTDDSRAVTPLKLANSPYAHLGYAEDIGDGSTVNFTITHNLGTQDVQVQVRRNSGNFDYISVCTGAPTANTVQVIFATGLAPTANQFRVLVTRVV